MPNKLFQLRVNDEWERRLDATIREIPTSGGRPPSRAAFVRETIEMESMLWRRSPYVCEISRNVVFVTKNGSYLYLRRELLHLRSRLNSVPAHLETRLNKRDLSSDLWALHAFMLRYNGIVKAKADDEGTTSKSVLFEGPFIEGSRVQREGCFLLNKYS